MRHRKGLKKLNRTSSHRKAMFANMAESLLKHESIKTTLVKAKSLRPFVEKIITKAKEKNLATIRYLASIFPNHETVKKLTDDIGQRVAKRQGGYTRIYKMGFRPGDATDMALIELVDRKVVVEKKAKESVEKSVKIVEETAAVKEVKEIKKSGDKLKSSTAENAKSDTKSSKVTSDKTKK